MCERETQCCEFFDDLVVDRRDFVKTIGTTVASVAGAGLLGSTVAAAAASASPKKAPKPAEGLIRELYSTLTPDQKKTLVLPWNHREGKSKMLSRHGMYNRPFNKQRIDASYTKPQQELIQRTLRSICSDEKGYEQITRKGTFDNSKSLGGCGAHIFGDASDDNKFAWLFTGHHLTVRCDGNSEPGAAFGGPLYYGHLAGGYTKRNVFYYQTQAVEAVYEALNEKQRAKAVATGSPGEQAKSVKFRGRNAKRPGIAYKELSADQRTLVEGVMRSVLSPFRKEDGDEVMQIVKKNGGMEKIHLAFYKDKDSTDRVRWHFWRLEGPGFVWNYRPLPHVHCFVNISSAIA